MIVYAVLLNYFVYNKSLDIFDSCEATILGRILSKWFLFILSYMSFLFFKLFTTYLQEKSCFITVASQRYQVILNWLWFMHNCQNIFAKVNLTLDFNLAQNIIKHWTKNILEVYFNKAPGNNFQIEKTL